MPSMTQARRHLLRASRASRVNPDRSAAKVVDCAPIQNLALLLAAGRRWYTAASS